MEIATSTSGEVTFVRMAGRLTSTTAGQVYDELVRVAQSGCKKVVVNLRDLEFIASAGLRSLLVAAKLLDGSQGQMRMCEASAPVRSVLENSGFDNLVKLCADEDEALASMS